MRHIYTLYIALLFCFNGMVSQVNFLDTLPYSKTYKFGSPQEEVLGLIENAKHYMVINPSLSISFIKKARKLSKEINFSNGLAYAKLVNSNYNMIRGNFAKAMEETLEALKTFESSGEIKGIRSAKNIIAALERENRNFDKGIEICLNLISEMSNEPDSIQLGFVYLNTANIFMNYRDEKFVKAKDYLEEAKRIFNSLDCKTCEAMVNVKYGRFYKVSNFVFEVSSYHDKVLEHVNKALKVFERFKQKENIIKPKLLIE